MSEAYKLARNRIASLLTAESVLQKLNYDPDNISRSGNSLRIYCPIHKESMIRSMVINASNGTFRCHYAQCPGNEGGDLLTLHTLVSGMSERDALYLWAGALGMDVRIPPAVVGVEEEQPLPAAFGEDVVQITTDESDGGTVSDVIFEPAEADATPDESAEEMVPEPSAVEFSIEEDPTPEEAAEPPQPPAESSRSSESKSERRKISYL